jgi:hypothetical protein
VNTELGPAGLAVAAGTFASASGGRGVFTGTYRLERFVSEYGQLAAVGVVTGALFDTDGTEIGMDSRQQTVAVEVAAGLSGVVARLGPVDVNLFGFLVSVDEIAVEVPPGTAACVFVEGGET